MLPLFAYRGVFHDPDRFAGAPNGAENVYFYCLTLNGFGRMRLPENCVNARSGASIQRGSRAVVISTLIRLCILHSTNLHALRETGQVHTANCKLNFNVQNKRSSVCANLRPYRSSVTIRIRQRPKRSATQLSIIQRQMCKYTAVTNLLLFHGGEVPQRLTSHTPFLHSDGQLLQRLSPGFPLSC